MRHLQPHLDDFTKRGADFYPVADLERRLVRVVHEPDAVHRGLDGMEGARANQQGEGGDP